MQLHLLPSALCVFVLFSQNVVAAKDRMLLPRRYLNTTVSIPYSSSSRNPMPNGQTDTDEPYHAPAFESSLTGESAIVTTPPDLAKPALADGITGNEDGRKGEDGGSIKSDSEDVRPEETVVKTDEVRDTLSSSLFNSVRPSFSTSRPMFTNYSMSATTTQVSSCTIRRPDEASTVYIILPNPSTVTATVGGNYTASYESPLPEFTPPTYCPEAPSITTRFTPSWVPPTYNTVGPTTTKSKVETTPSPEPGFPQPEFPPSQTTIVGNPVFTYAPTFPISITTVITTSKNPVTTFVSNPVPAFPDAGDHGVKQTVTPNDQNPPGAGSQAGRGPSNPNSSGEANNQGSPQNSPHNSPQNPPFQDRPSQDNPPVFGVGTGDTGIPNYQPEVARPVTTGVRGIPVEVAQSYAVVAGTTVRYMNPPSTDLTTISPQQGSNGNIPRPTNVVIIDGGIFSAVGRTAAVFDGQTIEYNKGETQTTVFHRETITLGASITFDGTTIGGVENIGTRLGIAGGISVTQIGQSEAIISSSSLLVGPQAVVTTVVIDTYTVVANSAGLEVDGTTLSYPFMPVTQFLTVGDITMTQIGSTLLVLEGVTYTIGGAASFGTPSNNRQSSTLGLTTSRSTTSLPKSDDNAQPSPANPDIAAETSKKSVGTALRSTCTTVCTLLVILIGRYL